MSAQTLLVTVSGDDRPGVTSALFDAIADVGAEVLDLEQVVVRGHLTLAMLLAAGRRRDRPAARSSATSRRGSALNVKVQRRHRATTRHGARGRAAVVVLGAPLLASAVAAVTARIAAHGANIDRIRRLSRYPVTTVEFDVSGADVAVLRRELALESQPSAGSTSRSPPAGLARRGRRLVVMDVDSTLIQDEVIELLAAHAGREAEVAAVTEAAMRGELDFADSLRDAGRGAWRACRPACSTRCARQSGSPPARAPSCARSSGSASPSPSSPAASSRSSATSPASSASTTRTPTAWRSSTACSPAGSSATSSTGPARRPRCAGSPQRQRLPLSRTVAIGDGANDLDMLDAAGLGIAFNAKPVVREQADTAVNVPYLDAVLYLLGITREEIEEADAADGTPTPAPPIPAR